MCVISPTVTPVDCGPPVTPQNGFLESYTDTTEGSEVFYSCGEHMVPEGRMTAVCTRNGWCSNPANLRCAIGMLYCQHILLKLFFVFSEIELKTLIYTHLF